MAVTNEQISAYLAANPGMTDAQIAAAMTQQGVTPAQMAQVTGIDQSAVQSRFNAATQNQASAPTDIPIGNFTLSQIANTPGVGSQGIGFGFAPMPLNLNITPSNFLANGAPVDFAAATRAGTNTSANQTASTPGAFTQATAQVAAPTQSQAASVPGVGVPATGVVAAPQATGALSQATAQPAAPGETSNQYLEQMRADMPNALLQSPNSIQDQIRDLYFGNFGRSPKQKDLDFWAQKFGTDVDSSEREEFKKYATSELTGFFGGESPNDEALLGGFKRIKELGVPDQVLRRTLGEDLYNKYNTGLTNFAVTNLKNIVADDQLTWDESQRIHNFGRDLGFTPGDLARLTGQNKSLFKLAENIYKSGRDQIIKSTLSDPSVVTDSDRTLAAFALQNQFKFTDDELAKASGLSVDDLKSSLEPVRNFSSTFGNTVSNPDTTTAQLKTLIDESRTNPAVSKMYGDSLNQVETKLNELEQKWSGHSGIDPLQTENLLNQINAQRNAIGGQYYSGVFGDTANMAAALNRMGIDTVSDLGQKDKFVTSYATRIDIGPNGQRVQDIGDGRFAYYDEYYGWMGVDKDQVTSTYGVVNYDDNTGATTFLQLSPQELATLKSDGSYQSKIGTVVIDKDTGRELTDTSGVLAMQRSGGYLKSKKNYINVAFTADGTPILTASQQKSGLYGFVSDIAPMVLTVASFIPGPHQPFARLASAALALDQKNYIGAVLSGLGAYGQFSGNELAGINAAEASGDIVNAGRAIELQNTISNIKLATNFAQGAAALQSQNIPGLINAGLSAYGQLNNTPLPSGVTTAVQLGNLGIAIENKQYDQALRALGDLTGSNDVKIAGAAKTLVDEFKKAGDTGDYSGVINAGLGLAEVVNSQPTKPVQQGGITNRIPDDMTEAGAAAFADAKRAGASDADAFAASNALTKIAEANETFDGSGFATQKEAMDAAIAEGLDKFTFGGKKYIIDNSAAQIADFEKSVKDELATRAKTDTEFGDLAGAQSAATARNTVAIGNAEANDVNEAAYLAKVRDPSATSFTFDGKTYNISASQTEMAQAIRNAALAEIKDLPNFNDAYAQARALLGPNQKFTWQGEEYSTATAQERPDLSAPAVQPATDESAAETARLAAQNRDLGIANAPNQSAAETARLAGQNAYLKSMEKTGFLGQIYKDLNEQFRLQGEAANDYLKNNPNSPITASVSSAFEAAGELQKNLGGVALALDNKPLADAIISGGKKLQDLGQSIGTAPEDTKNWKDTLDLVSKAQGAEKLAVLAGRIMDGTSGLARQVGVELRQELPALFLGGGLLRPTMIASGLIDTADTAGGAVVEAYDEAIKNGKTHQEALSAGRKAGAAAGATEAAIQLTFGKLGEVAVGKLDNLIAKGTTKVAGEGTVEGLQEAGSSAAVDLALGNAIDVNKALTQGVVGAAVGKGTAATTTPVDVATTPGFGDNAATQTAVTNISNNINTAISSGNTQNVGTVIADSVSSSINSGASTIAVVDSAIKTAITGGADPVVVVDNTITSAINAGAPVDTTIGSAVSSAVNAGADVSVVIDAATKAASSTGNDVTIASDANTVTINNATTNTGTTVDTITGSTVTVNNTTNDTTIVDPASNTTTQVSFDGNTQTTVIKDQANNTETVIKTDTNTGEVLEQSETQAPPSGTTTTGQPAAPDQAVLEGIVADQVGSLESRMNDAIADVKASGVEGDKVLQTAIDKVATDLGVTRESLLSRIEETGIDLRSEIEKGLSGVSAELKSSYDALNAEQKSLAESLASQGLDLETAISVAQEQTEQKIGSLESKFSDAIARAENAGIERDQAIQVAVDSVAKDLGLTRSEVISQLGTTESTLRSEFGAGISNLEAQMKDQYDSLTSDQKALADALTNQGVDLRTAIDTAQGQTQQKIENLESKFSDAISAAERSGLERDQAIQSAVDSVARDLGLTRSEVISQLGTTESTLRSEFGAGISGLESQMRDQYNSLTAEQKTLADALTNQGADLKTAIESAKQETQKQVQEQIQGVSEDVRAKYDALSEQQKTLADSLTSQGVDLRSAIDTAQKQTQEQVQQQIEGVSADVKAKYDALSEQQKTLADSLTNQGVDLRSAIDTAQKQTQEQVQQQIEGVSADVKAKYDDLTAQQKTLADSLTSQGVDLKSAIAQAQEQTQSQIQGVSADVKAKYDSLSSEQKTLSDALTNQGIDLKTAIDTAQKQTQEQLQGVTQDFQTKYENLSTQQKALADSLVEQGVNVNQAINTAQTVLQGQISKVSADVEAQYNELTSSQKDLADALVEQGVELKDALEFMKETLEKSFTERQDKLEKAMRLQGGQSQALGTIGPATILGLTASSLGSRETQKSIDPLARVKQAQAELEREAIMNQIDPRLLSVMQQRMDPQQQSNQFNKDIGALASLLGGEEAPANEGEYYSYGSEDSIDDILGGRAANYAAGGYVEPLKASGGSMALPLLVKSGGALDKYHGRENFKEGKHVAGKGDGQSDDIPAWLADGEFVFPADVVSALGNGSTKAGTDKLYEMMHNIRDRARSKGPKDLPPPALKSPLDYLKSSKRSTK